MNKDLLLSWIDEELLFLTVLSNAVVDTLDIWSVNIDSGDEIIVDNLDSKN